MWAATLPSWAFRLTWSSGRLPCQEGVSSGRFHYITGPSPPPVSHTVTGGKETGSNITCLIRSGLPAQSDRWSVTVVADRCEQAQVAAKVAFIHGSKQGADFLWRHRIAGLLVHQAGAWETVEPWPAQLMEEAGILRKG